MGGNILKGFEYLSDKEIELTSESDLLGNSIYVDQLIEMISYSMKTQQVESIGLYGGWGSGKTSIVKSLKKAIELNNGFKGRCRFFTYNAWQYNNDSFRKNFIASIIDNDEDKEKYLNKVYTSETETTIKINEKLKKYRFLFIGVIIIVAVLYFCIKSNLNRNDFNDALNLLSEIISLGIFAYVADFIFKKIAVETQISKHREYSPYDFLDDFKEQIKKKEYYSIFVIDDIDRCSTTQVLEILETIKGLLKSVDKYNYLFLIPLDKERIISILKSEKNYSDLDCINYFSKIFDLSIEMKQVGNLNLFEMAKNKSNEIDLDISNNSLSLLTDFIFSTPRDVKSTLNTLKIMNQLLEKKVIKRFVLNKSDENIFEEFVILYILEYRWKSFFDFVIAKAKKWNIDLKIQFESYHSNDSKIDDELKSFIGRLSETKMKYFDAYVFLKNDKAAIDDDILNKMLYINFESLNENDYLNNQFICTLEYFYKIYIVERELYDRYLSRFIVIYFKFIQINSKNYDKLTRSSINFNFILKIMSENNFSDQSIDDFVIKTTKVIQNEDNLVLTSEMNKFYEIYINKFLLKSKHTESKINFAKSKIFNQIKIDKNERLILVKQIIKEDKNSEKFIDIINQFKSSQEDLEELLDTSIENKRIDIISDIVHMRCTLLKKYSSQIFEVMSFKQVINNSQNLNNELEQKHFENELDIINLGLSKDIGEVVAYVDNTSVISYCDRHLRQLLGISKFIAEKYIKFVNLYDGIKYKNLSLIPKLVEVLCSENTNDVLLKTIQSYDYAVTNELYILAISMNNKNVVSNYIDFVKKETSVNLDVWYKLAETKNNISFGFNYISYHSVTMNYVFFKDYLFINLLNINIEFALNSMNKYSIKDLFKINGFDSFISGLKKKDDRRLLLITLIKDIDDYSECLKFAAKSTNVTRYHCAFKNIVNNVSSVDELKKIHDKHDILDKTELNVIKEKVLRDYPQYKDDFNYISFK